MQQHPHFDLGLHDDNELTAWLGNTVTQRLTLHEWPLSCVQRIYYGENATHIYKVQSDPTVEPSFYQNSRSPLLVGAQIIPLEGGPSALLLEDLSGQTLHELSHSESEKLQVAEDLLTRISEAACVRSSQVVAAFNELTSYVHLDLTCENILVNLGINSCTDKSIRIQIEFPAIYLSKDLRRTVLMNHDDHQIIDWQRPIRGPVALDRLTLLNSLGTDPVPFVSVGIRQRHTLLQIDWLSQTALRWFPDGAKGYDEEIATRINQLTGNYP